MYVHDSQNAQYFLRGESAPSEGFSPKELRVLAAITTQNLQAKKTYPRGSPLSGEQAESLLR